MLAYPAIPAPAQDVERKRYLQPRRRELALAQHDAIRAAADGRSLRSLAREFNVSHESIRAVLRVPVPLAAD